MLFRVLFLVFSVIVGCIFYYIFVFIYYSHFHNLPRFFPAVPADAEESLMIILFSGAVICPTLLAHSFKQYKQFKADIRERKRQTYAKELKDAIKRKKASREAD